MTLYEQVKSIESDKLESLIEAGFLKSSFTRNLRIYERYLYYMNKGKPKTDAVVMAADDFNVSDRYVFTIIAQFSKL